MPARTRSTEPTTLPLSVIPKGPPPADSLTTSRSLREWPDVQQGDNPGYEGVRKCSAQVHSLDLQGKFRQPKSQVRTPDPLLPGSCPVWWRFGQAIGSSFLWTG